MKNSELTLEQINEKIKELEARKNELEKEEAERLASEKEERLKEIDEAYDNYLKLVKDFYSDYGEFQFLKSFDFEF